MKNQTNVNHNLKSNRRKVRCEPWQQFASTSKEKSESAKKNEKKKKIQMFKPCDSKAKRNPLKELLGIFCLYEFWCITWDFYMKSGICKEPSEQQRAKKQQKSPCLTRYPQAGWTNRTSRLASLKVSFSGGFAASTFCAFSNTSHRMYKTKPLILISLPFAQSYDGITFICCFYMKPNKQDLLARKNHWLWTFGSLSLALYPNWPRKWMDFRPVTVHS